VSAQAGRVTVGKIEYIVAVTSEDARRSLYAVSSDDLNRQRNFKPGTVRVGVECVFVCLTCLVHPSTWCIHTDAVKKFVAAQPLEVVP